MFVAVARAALFCLTLCLLTTNYNSVRVIASLEMTMPPVEEAVGAGQTLGSGVTLIFSYSSTWIQR